VPKPKIVTPPTRAQKLAAALKLCHKLKKPKKRASCIAAAKKRYAPPKAKNKVKGR